MSSSFFNPTKRPTFTFKGGIADGETIIADVDTYWVEYPDPKNDKIYHAYARTPGSTVLVFREVTTKRLSEQTKPKDRK